MAQQDPPWAAGFRLTTEERERLKAEVAEAARQAYHAQTRAMAMEAAPPISPQARTIATNGRVGAAFASTFQPRFTASADQRPVGASGRAVSSARFGHGGLHAPAPFGGPDYKPDPLVRALAPTRPKNPWSYQVDKDGVVLKPSSTYRPNPNPFRSSGDQPLEPVSPAEKQAYVEWLVGASATRPPGVQSPEEIAARSLMRPAAPPPPRQQLEPEELGVQALLERIALGEGTDDATAQRYGLASGYDASFSYGRYGKGEKPISEMTLDEVDALQLEMLKNGSRSTAVGKYQFIRSTLGDLKSKLRLSGSEVLDAALQERLARELMQRHLDAYLAGSLTEEQLQNRLAAIWASMAESGTGRSRYENQHVGTSTEEIRPFIRGVRPSR